MDVVNGQLGSITFLTGSQCGKVFQITKPTITIGREPTNDIVLSEPSISRHHAQIALANGVWTLTKLAQQNTLSINSRAMQQAVLSNGDTVGLGTNISFRFQAGDVSRNNAAHNAPVAYNVVQVAPVHANPMPVASPNQPPVASVQSPHLPTQQAAGTGGTVGMSIPSLEVTANTDTEKKVYPLPLGKQVFNIGRDPSNDIVINRPTVSGLHAQIIRKGNELVIVHPHPQKGSTANGLSYNGQVYRGSTAFSKPLMRGDLFRIADEHGSFVTLTYNDGSGAIQEAIPEIKPFRLGAAVVTIGRAPDNMVVLNHPQVSAHHARLDRVGSDYKIIDLGSTNHIYVGGQMVRDQVLRAGSEIRIGPFKLIYTGTELTQHDERDGIRIDALNVTKTVNDGKTIIINDISIAIPPRSFVALVGGSGAGKSTLMDVLNGLRPAQQGTVLYNGQDYYKNLASFSTQLGYVPQDDIVHRDLTVERALYYAAKLRLPSDFTEKQIKQRIDDVLKDVDMTFRRNVLVSKLSGGQRKRVSIALELLADPNVFFLDEPTSGLDPGLDRKMMQLLRNLADRGRTIVLVTHATNNIKSCDYVCFLCRGGRLAYFGPPDEAKTFFGKSDFAEIYSALEPHDDKSTIPQEAELRFKQSLDYMKYVDAPLRRDRGRIVNAAGPVNAVSQPKRGNPWQQFSLLSARYLELLKNDVGNLMILLLQAPIIGLVLFLLTNPAAFTVGNDSNSLLFCPPNTINVSGQSVTYNNCNDLHSFLQTDAGVAFAQQNGGEAAVLARAERAGGGNAETTLFIMAFAAVMFGCINGAREIVKEAPIYHRERTVNLGIMPYMFSKIVVLGTLCLAQSLVLTFLVSLRAPFPHSTLLPPFLEIYTTMALTSLAGLMLGLTVSALVPNNDRAMSIVPLVLIPQVIFSGIIFKLDGPVLQILGAFFPARWAMAAMGSSVGIHGDLINADSFSFQGTLFSKVSQADAVFHLLLCWFFLVLTIFVLGGLIGYFIKRKDVRG